MNTRTNPVPLALRVVLLIVTTGYLRAAETPPAFEAGVSVTLEAAAGVRGGAERGQSLQALSLAHASWQNQPAESAAQLRAFASVLNHEGRGPTGRYLGDFLAASNIEAFDSTRLYSWWFEVEQAGWSLRAGALLADEEFGGTDGGGHLVNSAFGWPAFISANTVNTGPAFFVAAPGVRLARTITPALTWRGGIYDGDTFDSPEGDPTVNRHGLRYRLGGAQGGFLMTELVYAPEAGPTRLKLGAWHHTATFADQHVDAAGRPFLLSGAEARAHSGNTGIYASVEHVVVGSPGKPGHVDTFLRLGAAPSDRNTLTWALDTGLSWHGPFPGRPADVAAIGLAHAAFSSRAAATARLLDPTAPALDHEQAMEISYTVSLNDRISLKPDFQYIRHPGGSRAQRDALLVMLRVNAEF
jgi:porin